MFFTQLVFKSCSQTAATSSVGPIMNIVTLLRRMTRETREVINFANLIGDTRKARHLLLILNIFLNETYLRPIQHFIV